VPLIVGFGEACRIAAEVMTVESVRTAQLRDKLESALLAAIPSLKRNGDLKNRLPNNSSLTFPGVDAESLIMSMPELALSTGSACNSGAQDPSYVLRAIGLSHEDAQFTLRVGIGRFTTSVEINESVETVISATKRLSREGQAP
jgi:cysteine desulfurase